MRPLHPRAHLLIRPVLHTAAFLLTLAAFRVCCAVYGSSAIESPVAASVCAVTVGVLVVDRCAGAS